MTQEISNQGDREGERMENIYHFSHDPEHPLILKLMVEKNEEEEKKCYGCQKEIDTNDNYYACEFTEDNCKDFYLHKKCADLPREINLPIHIHPLTLLASPLYENSSCSCNICHRAWEWLTYNCSLCEFDIDALCASTLMQLEGNNILEHEGHPHPLTLIARPCLFHCDACDTEDEKDLSYFCNTCQFMIHKSCASAPRSYTGVGHYDCDYSMILAYSLPEQYRNSEPLCHVCNEKVHISYWLYYCANCWYFSHLKCAASRIAQGENDIPDYEDPEPPYSTSVFIANNCTSAAYDDANGKAEIHHRFHDHTLSIHNDTAHITNNNQPFSQIRCDGCVRPISVPFYSCSQCNFFLHRFCAELPEEIPCPQEPKHLMKVTKFEKNCSFVCSFCLLFCSGFACECVSCGLRLDILCASSRIKHDSHRHPLVRCQSNSYKPKMECNSCSKDTGDSITFSCKTCSFNLCIDCVKLPGSQT